jgi:hypothetical protein
MPDFSWSNIVADLHTRTVAATPEVSLPKVNVYFEDGEGADLFDAVIAGQRIKKFLNPLRGVTLGCSNYIQLARKKIPEFTEKSVILLDADVQGTQGIGSVVLLPGALPPDQLIFEYLYNLDPADPLWQNKVAFTRPVFTSVGMQIINRLNLGEAPVNLKQVIDAYQTGIPAAGGPNPPLRELFKGFYKSQDFQRALSIKGSNGIWKRWCAANAAARDAFRERFSARILKTMEKGYGVDPALLIPLAPKAPKP